MAIGSCIRQRHHFPLTSKHVIVGTLSDWKTLPALTDQAVWRVAFAWIEREAQSAEDGVFSLGLPGFTVRVMSYGLLERGEAKYESHRNTIDLQASIEGAEGIEYTPVQKLMAKGEYLREKDFQHYETPERPFGRIENYPGQFCILFPGDGHMPKLKVQSYGHVRKLVVKIPFELLL